MGHLIFCSTIISLVFLQDSDPPTASKIVDNYIDALGGEMLLVSQKFVSVKGTDSNGKQESKFSLRIANNNALLISETPNETQIRSGFDGEYFWVVQDGGGYKRKTETGILTSGFEFFGRSTVLSWQDIEGKANVVGRKMVGERETWLVTFEFANGLINRNYFEIESGLLVKSSYGADNPTDFYLEYSREQADGSRFVSKVFMKDGSFVCEVDSFEVCDELDLDLFKPPSGIDEAIEIDDD